MSKSASFGWWPLLLDEDLRIELPQLLERRLLVDVAAEDLLLEIFEGRIRAAHNVL